MPEAPDTGETPPPGRMQEYILIELQRIRYRLGVLVAWFVVLPIVAGLIVWTVLSFD